MINIINNTPSRGHAIINMTQSKTHRLIIMIQEACNDKCNKMSSFNRTWYDKFNENVIHKLNITSIKHDINQTLTCY